MATRQSDRNLLVGILALQMDFISRDQLIECLSTWVLDKDTPLEQVLADHGALDEPSKEVLAALVDQHVKVHDGDVERSLAAVSALAPLKGKLSGLGDDDLEASLAVVHEGEENSSLMTETFSVAPAAASRFRILRPHARGGLGEVFVAQDEELGREVALKQIQSEHADRRDSRARFTAEAEITGRLEHPGIVPVYGLGQYADGRPFYAMRFIRGQSFKEAIAEFHRGDAQTRTSSSTVPSHRYGSVEFRRLLGRFVDVCQSVDYAHSRGVLHRDLKPSNIMLGKYGETLVVDWGLAKVVGSSEAEASLAQELPVAIDQESGQPTQMGAAIGTPAYMSPEQAAGRLDLLGPATDVYSLGATLYSLLCGSTAFSGDDVGATLADIQHGRFPTPRSRQPHVPRALEAICLMAMSTDPSQRYESSSALADDIESFLADEPVRAFTESAPARARRWVRKHQTFSATAAAVALVTIVGLGAFSVVLSGKNTDLGVAMAQEQEARVEAEENEQIARQQSELARSTLGSVLFDIQHELGRYSGNSEVRRRVLRLALDGLQKVSTQFVTQAAVDGNSFDALTKQGDLILQFGATDTIAVGGTSPSQFSEINESDLSAARASYEKAHEIALNLASELADDPRTIEGLALSHLKLGDLEVRVGAMDEALEHYSDALELLQPLVERSSGSDAKHNLWLAQLKLAHTLAQVGATQEAEPHYHAALRIAQEMCDAEPANLIAQRDLWATYMDLGLAAFHEDVSQAKTFFQDALSISLRLAERRGSERRARLDLSFSYRQLGLVLSELGSAEEARRLYESARDICSEIVMADPADLDARGDYAMVLAQLGSIEVQLGRSELALSSFRQALDIQEELAAIAPDNVQQKKHLWVTYTNLGNIHRGLGTIEKAYNAQRLAMEIAGELVEIDSSAVMTRRLASSYQSVAELDLLRGSIADASANISRSREIFERLLEQNPNDRRAQRGRWMCLCVLGDIHNRSRNGQEALDTYRKALTISEQVVKERPNDMDALRDLLHSYRNMGDTNRGFRRFELAANFYERGLKVADLLADEVPGTPTTVHELSRICRRLGDVRRQMGAVREAIELFERALQASEAYAERVDSDVARRELVSIHLRIGDANRQLGQEEEAAKSFRQALQICQRLSEANPNHEQDQQTLATTYERLAAAYHGLQQWAEATAEYRNSAAAFAKMISRGQLVNFAQNAQARVEQQAGATEQMAVALGDWNALLAAPSESQARLLEIRAFEFMKQSQVDEAATAAIRLTDSDTADRFQLYNSAWVLSRCAESLQPANGNELSKQQTTQQEEWIKKALVALNKSIKLGFQDFDQMNNDQGLKLIRKRPEFEELLQSVAPEMPN